MNTFEQMITAKPKGLRRDPVYRPAVGEVCLASGPNCDDDDGYTWLEMTMLWADEVFVLYGQENCWPVLHKWEHVLFEPLPKPPIDEHKGPEL